MNSEGRVVEVEIFGQVYPVRANVESEEYIRKVAEYVDSKMKEISKGLHASSDTKVAILAALNVADELFSLMERQEDEVSHLKKQITQYSDVLDRAIKG